MHGAVTQRSSSGFTAAAAAGHSSDFLASKTRASNFGFQRWQPERCVPSRQSINNVRLFVVKIDATASGSGKSVAPLQPESPAGQFLVQLLQTHPHLFSVAAEQQLDKLAEDRNAAEAKEPSSTEGGDMVLYKRIAELKAQERRATVEDIMYTLVSHRFLEAHIAMVPKIPPLVGNQKVDILPAQDRELQSVHSSEAWEMVWEHLTFIMGVKGAVEFAEDSIMVPISKLQMGQVYAFSALYGYFLRRVDEKFQMEKALAPRPSEPKKQAQETQRSSELKKQPPERKGHKSIENDSFAAEMLAIISAMLGIKQGSSFIDNEQSTNRLQNYVLSFEADTLYRCVRIRSMESVCIIERQTQALFGKPDMLDTAVMARKEETMILSLAGLKRLVLEAVAFGSFLWDAETFVDSRYPIVAPEGH